MGIWKRVARRASRGWEAANRIVVQAAVRGRCKLSDAKGQGTTEYAILVGVLVVIAIIAITAFRPNIEKLWTAIKDGIQGL